MYVESDIFEIVTFYYSSRSKCIKHGRQDPGCGLPVRTVFTNLLVRENPLESVFKQLFPPYFLLGNIFRNRLCQWQHLKAQEMANTTRQLCFSEWESAWVRGTPWDVRPAGPLGWWRTHKHPVAPVRTTPYSTSWRSASDQGDKTTQCVHPLEDHS